MKLRATLWVVPLLVAGCGNDDRREVSPSRQTRLEPSRSRTAVSGYRAVRDGESGRVLAAPPARADSPHYVSALDVFREHVLNGSAVIVDGRSPDKFAKGHVRGAYNLPAGQEAAYIGPILQEVPFNQLILIYCGGQQCHASDQVYEYLASQGYTNLRVFGPGWRKLSSQTDILE